MIKYTYDHELMTMSTMFMNSMSDIVVKRFNVHKQPRDQIKTRIVYAPKQRVLNDLLNRDQNLQLPVISVHIGGIARDEARVFNKILGTFHTPSNSNSSTNEKGPLPVDITYNVTIMTRYQQDMDQILSHLLPYVNPYFVISWRTPHRPDHEIRSNVFWSGNANIQYPFDIAATQTARVVADLTFTFKGWLFQNQETIGNIFTFNTNFVAAQIGIPSEYLLDSAQDYGEYSETVVYRATPPQPKVIEPYSTSVGVLQQFDVWGAGFERVTNVYLSGSPLSSISTLQDPFSANPALSANYPAFSAVKLLSSEWAFNRDNYVTFVMPSTEAPGTLELIVENPGGYGKLTENVRVSNFNPFIETSLEYASFVPYQVPYLSGISIF